MLRFAVWALVAVIATPVHAAAAPLVKPGAPYMEARRVLISHGYVPVKILRSARCGGERPACNNELLGFGGVRWPWAQFLYARRYDDALFVVWTGEIIDQSDDGSMITAKYEGIERARESRLREFDLTIVTPSGRRRTFQDPPPKYVEPPAPLCSENGGSIPCWVKPPPGHKRPPARPH